MDDIKGEHMEACSVRAMWTSLEADARALRDVNYQGVVESAQANLGSTEEKTQGREDGTFQGRGSTVLVQATS